MPTAQTPDLPKPAKSHQQQLREAVNTAAVEMVGQGFEAIDQLAEIGKNYLKKAIVDAISGPPRKRPL